MTTGPCDCVRLREQVRVMEKALSYYDPDEYECKDCNGTGVVESEAVRTLHGIEHPYPSYKCRCQVVKQALKQESLGDGK